MAIKTKAWFAPCFFIVLIFALVNVSGFAAESVIENAPDKASVFEEFFPDGLIDAEQNSVDTANLEGKLFALYFSASWCRGCVAFSRILVPFRNRHQEKFEVVLIGFDHNSPDMHAYMKNYEMLWPAVQWDSPSRIALKERFKVTDIPTLIVLAPDGRVITTDGYKQIDLMGDEALENWLKLAK